MISNFSSLDSNNDSIISDTGYLFIISNIFPLESLLLIPLATTAKHLIKHGTVVVQDILNLSYLLL